MSEIEAQVKARFEALAPFMDERMTRLWVAAEARSLGYGGQAAVMRATGIREKRIQAGLRELAAGPSEYEEPSGKPRIRRPGAGRPRAEERDPGLVDALLTLVDPETRGEPDSPLRWTSKSTRKLAAELTANGHPVSPKKVRQLLKEQGFSLQANKKTREGSDHPDRDAQFKYINELVQAHQGAGQPAVSVDTKKKENIGDFKNGGREWHPKGEPETVRTHDFIDRELGKAIPYGVYDMSRNEGFVSVGISHDTSEFAVATIERWWAEMGRPEYPEASQLLVTADSGGSNSSRARLWKSELQAFADRTGLEVTVCHFPPGTSKWNKIEHRMFSHISQNWRGRPLVSREAVVSLIANTETTTGLTITARLDENLYEKGIRVADAEMDELNLMRHEFHGDWNYTIRPRAAQ